MRKRRQDSNAYCHPCERAGYGEPEDYCPEPSEPPDRTDCYDCGLPLSPESSDIFCVNCRVHRNLRARPGSWWPY